jgi:hypothetical protein
MPRSSARGTEFGATAVAEAQRGEIPSRLEQATPTAYNGAMASEASTLAVARLRTLVLVALGAAVLFAVACMLFVTQYFNYGAEGIEVGALMRMNAGLPYLSRASEVPLFLNQYSPYFYATIHAPIQILGIESLESTVLCARLLLLATAGALVVIAYRGFAHWAFSKRSLAFVALWFLALFPANIISIRPDLPSFVLELAGLCVWLRGVNAPQRSTLAIAAGALFGCAIAFKLNTVGAVGGVLIYEASERKWARATVIAATTGAAVSVFVAIAWAVWGPGALADTFVTLRNQLETPADVARRLGGVLFYATPMVVLMVFGLRYRSEQSRLEAKAIYIVLATSLVLATLQQVKFGAWYNYYYGFFAIGLAPAALGLDRLLALAASRPLLPVAMLLTALAHAAWGTRVPLVIVRDHVRKHYPFAEAVSWIEKEFPSGAVYSHDSNALLRFQKRTLLGPESEVIVAVTPALHPRLPEIKANMSKHAFAVGVATGPDCDQWKPAGLFLEETSQLTQMVRRFGWICVLARNDGRHRTVDAPSGGH